MVRYTDSGKVLDYLAEFNVHSIQTVEYGKNLMDVKITRDHTERIAALIPLGAKKKTTDEEGNEVESDERIDITSVNGGQNYIYDDAAVKEIGWIWTTEVWENVTLPGNLLRKANALVAQRASEKGIEKGNGKYQQRYAFSGKIICVECGDTFKRRIHPCTTYKYVAWTCNTHLKDTIACSMKYIRDDEIKAAYIRNIL